jgi:hypothetical protein
MPDVSPPDQLVSENPFLPYLHFFRFTHLLGDILSDLHHVRMMDLDRVALRDRELIDLQNEWPPDMNLGDYGIATALSSNSPEDVRRKGVQCVYLIGMTHCTEQWNCQNLNDGWFFCLRSI